jgi:catechol 2,3-dioxygenase
MATAQDRMSLTKSKLIDRIARVDLRVRDINNALSFYRNVVGLGVQHRDDDRVLLAAGGGQGFLQLDSSTATMSADRRATGLFHIAIRFPSRAALGDALARLSEAGFRIGNGDHLVSEALYIDDPDGNGVELYWDRPVEEWPAPSGGMIVPMATLPVDLEGVLREGRGSAAVGERAQEGTDMGHVHLQVSDIGETTRFYADLLGLDLIARLGDQAGFYSSKGYHHNIGANTWASRGGSPAGKQHAGLDRIVFGTSAEELEGLRDRLGDRAETREDGSVMIRDPDEIELNFVTAPEPGTTSS